MKLNFDYVKDFISDELISEYVSKASEMAKQLVNKTGLGNDFLGWVNWPNEISQEEIDRINYHASIVRKKYNCLVVIGIGGSYTGAKAAIDMLRKKYADFEIVFLGNTLSECYTYEVLEHLRTKNFAVNVVSKSGTTLEPAIGFRIVLDLLKEKYGENCYERVYTTNSSTGVLHNIAVKNNYTEFIIPDDIGGRYSVLTAVGLFPLACAGCNIEKILEGASRAYYDFTTKEMFENDAIVYAAVRNALYSKGKKIELLVSYSPRMRFFGEWWKQLYGESEGKDHKGIFPATVFYTMDLHSLGQYIQDGERSMFETIVEIESCGHEVVIKETEDDEDGLNYLAGKTIGYVNKKAMLGTLQAHVDGGVPNVIVKISKNDEYHFGYLVYFFMFACGISGYILGVNPFNQKGVEAYKKNMFKLLGK